MSTIDILHNAAAILIGAAILINAVVFTLLYLDGREPAEERGETDWHQED